jgi:hypothetical protein
MAFTTGARLVHHVSYRDEYSRQAMLEMGVRRKHDRVFPDLVFALPAPSDFSGAPGSVAVGVMAYGGTATDGGKGQTIHDTYLQGMKEFVRWLLETGHEVRLLIGDHDDEPEGPRDPCRCPAALAGPGAPPVDFQPVSSTDALMSWIAFVETLFATRSHNVLVALAYAQPTLAIAYGGKHRALMAQMDAEEFCQDIRELDVERPVERSTWLTVQIQLDGHAMATVSRGLSETKGRLPDQLCKFLTWDRDGTGRPRIGRVNAGLDDYFLFSAGAGGSRLLSSASGHGRQGSTTPPFRVVTTPSLHPVAQRPVMNAQLLVR